MGLPSSGPISMNDIRVELGVPTQSPFSLDTARAGGYVTLNVYSPSTPPSTGEIDLTDWYNYCQTCDAYYFATGSTSAIACGGTANQFIISDTIPIGVGSILTYLGGGSAQAEIYYSDGTDWYYAESPLEVTTVTSAGSCSGPTYNLYYADEYYCDGTTCEFQQSDVLVALSTAVSPSYTRYYPLQAGGFAYQLTSTATTGPGAILEVTSYTNCSLACGVV